MVYCPYFPQGATRIYPQTPAQELEGIRKPVTTQDNLEKAIAIATLPAKYHPSIYDNKRGVHLRDETWGQFIEWRKTGEEDQTIEEIKPEKSIGIMIPTEGKEHHASIVGVKMPYAHIKINMREVGAYVSRYANFKHDLLNYMRSDAGQALAAFLNKSGLKAEELSYIGVGFLPENAIYAVGRLADGRIVILSNKDAYQKISKWAGVEGIKPEEVKEAAIGEEITHIFRKSQRSIGEERATKTMLMDMYKELASKTLDKSLRARYERIIRHIKGDIATVERYKETYSGLQELVGLFNLDIGKLEAVLEAKAIAEEGISSNEGIREYVTNSLEAIAKATGKEHLDKPVAKSVNDGDGKTGKAAYSKGEKAADSAEDNQEDSGDGETVCASKGSGEGANGEDGSGEGGGEAGGGEGGSSGGDGGGSGGE